MNMYTHSCLKCSAKYEDPDPDPYYCDPCNAKRIELAKQVDAKIQARPPKQAVSALKEYDNSPKVHGFVHVRL